MKQLSALIFSFVAFVSYQTLSCSCAPPASVKDSFHDMNVVMNAQVISMVEEEGEFAPNKAVRMTVLKNWKGMPWQKQTVVRTAAHSASCGNHYEVGEKYLVYAYINNDGNLSTNICGRTKHMSNADKDISELKEIVGK